MSQKRLQGSLRPLLGLAWALLSPSLARADYPPERPEASEPSPWIKVQFPDEAKKTRVYWCHETACGASIEAPWKLDRFKNSVVPLYRLTSKEHHYEQASQANYYESQRSAYSLHYGNNAGTPLVGRGFFHERYTLGRASAQDKPKIVLDGFFFPLELLLGTRPQRIGRGIPNLEFFSAVYGYNDKEFAAVRQAFANGYAKEGLPPANAFIKPKRRKIKEAVEDLLAKPGDRQEKPGELLEWEAHILVPLMGISDKETS